MATISKRITSAGNVRWHVRVRRLGQPTVCKSFTLKGDAQTWARQAEAGLDRGHAVTNPQSRKHTLADLIDEFNGNAPRIASQHDREQRLKWWSEQYGSLPLASLDAAVVSRGRQRLATERFNTKNRSGIRAPQTVRHYLMALSACLDYGRRELRWLTTNPVAEIDVPPVSPGRIQWLTSEQREALLAACDRSGNPHLGLVARIALISGGRLSEITGLRWSWIDLQQECAFLPTTKNGEPRVLPLPGEFANLLRERGKVRRLDSDLVFPSPINPMRPRNMWQAWCVARKRAGLPGWRFHDCRHDAATAMLRAGVDSRVVATVLGHRSMNMLRRYAHVTPSAVVKAAKAIQGSSNTKDQSLHSASGA